jgi:hypothetical protein
MKAILGFVIMLASTCVANATDVRTQFGYAGPAEVDTCWEESGVHVKNGFDIAYESAEKKALVDCLRSDFNQEVRVTYVNHGLIGDPAFPYLVCEVEYLYTCR